MYTYQVPEWGDTGASDCCRLARMAASLTPAGRTGFHDSKFALVLLKLVAHRG